jgi:hypothetical protein
LQIRVLLIRLQWFESPRFSADGSLLASRNWQNEIYLWRAPSWGEAEAAERNTSVVREITLQNRCPRCPLGRLEVAGLHYFTGCIISLDWKGDCC